MKNQSYQEIVPKMAPYFISYVLISVLFLMCSLWVTRRMETNLQSATRVSTETRFASILDDMDRRCAELANGSIRLANKPKLLADQMLRDEISRVEGIDILAEVCLNNDFIWDVFFDYGVGRVYSAKKASDIDVQFRNVMGCAPASIDAGIQTIRSAEKATALLRTAYGDGMLLLHFPVRNAEGVSVNYCVLLSEIEDRLRPLFDTVNGYVQFTAADGTRQTYAVANKGVFTAVDAAEYPTGRDRRHYIAMTRDSTLGVQIEVLCRADMLYREVHRSQVLNIVILLIGLLAAMAVSAVLSVRRSRKLTRLEQSISNRDPERIRGGEFDHVAALVQNIVNESETWAHDAAAARRQLRQQITSQLFRGFFADRESLCCALQTCGSELNAEYYAVGGLFPSADKPISDAALAQLDELYCIMLVRGRPVVFFLAELPDMDYLRTRRRAKADALLRRIGLATNDVRVAFSCVRGELDMVNVAYMEVMSLARLPELPAEPAVLFCEDQLNRNRNFVQLLPEQTAPFAEAIRAGESGEMTAQFLRLSEQISASGATEENKQYLRFCLLQLLIPALSARAGLEQLTAHVDVTNAERFEKSMVDMIRHYCNALRAHENIGFDAILEYIHAHYQEETLSLNELSQFSGIAMPQLSKLFKSETGMNYIDYLSKIRMEKAHELLLATDLTVRTIMETVGYVDKASFSRKFKAWFGVSAQELRRSAQTDAEKGADDSRPAN